MDIVTDTLHASSSDLITWNTLVMKKQGWHDAIPTMWLVITAALLEAWHQRDQEPPFLHDNRRGYARVNPVGLSCQGVPDQAIPPDDQLPLHGLGLREGSETIAKFNRYIWSEWTFKSTQPVHVNKSLQEMLDRLARNSPERQASQLKTDERSTGSPSAEKKGRDVASSFPTPLNRSARAANQRTYCPTKGRENLLTLLQGLMGSL